MGRIRYIKPEFASDTDLAEISITGRLFYALLFCSLDCNGIVEYNTKLLKRETFPYDEKITSNVIEELIQELISHKFLYKLEYDSKLYLYCPTFKVHQKFHPHEKPKYLIPDELLLATCQQPASNLLVGGKTPISSIGIGIGTGIGIGIGTGTGEMASPSSLHEEYNTELISSSNKSIQPMPKKKSSNGEKVKLVIAAYCEAYKSKFNKNPIMTGPETGAARNIAKLSLDFMELEKVIQHYLLMQDDWIESQGYSLSELYRNFNAIRHASDENRLNPKSKQEKITMHNQKMFDELEMEKLQNGR